MQGAYKLKDIQSLNVEIQGYIVNHKVFGREIRICHLKVLRRAQDEIRAWIEAISVRQQVLTKHWDFNKRQLDIFQPSQDLSLTTLNQNQNQSRNQNRNRNQAFNQNLQQQYPVIHTNTNVKTEETYSVDSEDSWRIDTQTLIEQLPTFFCSFSRKNGIADRGRLVVSKPGQVSLFLSEELLNSNVVYYGSKSKELEPRLYDRIPIRNINDKRVLKPGPKPK